jgi:DNA polymerase III epsilon subunit-like protein
MLFSVFDTETTGLPKHPDVDFKIQPRIIEFAGIITDGEKIISQIEFVCNPHEPLEAIITKITGFTDEDLADKPDFKDFVHDLKAHFGAADAIVAHNLSFDRDMVETESKHMGMTLPELSWPALEICTVEQTFPMYGRRMKLSELYELTCGPYVQKHRAMDDLMLLHEVCLNYGIYEAYKERAQ